MGDPDNPESLRDLDARLKEARRRQSAGERRPGRAVSGVGMGAGFRIAVEILAALAVGVGLGLALDQWLGTKPWLMILFFFLGCAAAMLNVVRTARELDRQRKRGADKQGAK